MADKEPIRTILARMEANQTGLKEQFASHIRHHWAVSIVILGATLSLISGIIVQLMFSAK